MTGWISQIDKIIYINLDRRTDRKQELENEFTRIGIPCEKIIRFSAITHGRPTVGCNLSHAGALKLANEMNLKNVLILEDDFNFIDDVEKINENLDLFFELVEKGLEWDGFSFVVGSEKFPKYNDHLRKCLKSSNAAAYLVNQHMILPLSETIGEAAPLLAKTGEHWKYANDVVWGKHMARGKWFTFNYPIGYQRLSYSDLSKKIVDHTCGLQKK